MSCAEVEIIHNDKQNSHFIEILPVLYKTKSTNNTIKVFKIALIWNLIYFPTCEVVIKHLTIGVVSLDLY